MEKLGSQNSRKIKKNISIKASEQNPPLHPCMLLLLRWETSGEIQLLLKTFSVCATTPHTLGSTNPSSKGFALEAELQETPAPRESQNHSSWELF